MRFAIESDKTGAIILVSMHEHNTLRIALSDELCIGGTIRMG